VVGFKRIYSKGSEQTIAIAMADLSRGYASQINAGGSRLFVMQRGLNLHFARRPAMLEPEDPNVLVQSAEVIKGTETLVGNAKSLVAFIDSTVVEGVGLVGPDIRNVRAHAWDRMCQHHENAEDP
jgi:hypothetical protein